MTKEKKFTRTLKVYRDPKLEKHKKGCKMLWINFDFSIHCECKHKTADVKLVTTKK